MIRYRARKEQVAFTLLYLPLEFLPALGGIHVELLQFSSR
jgi:hypothetical protein